MRVLLKTALVLFGLSILLVGVSFNVLRAQDLGPRDKAARVMASEVRPVTAEVVVIKVDSSVDLVLVQGAVPSMKVRAEQRVMSNIVTVQEGNTLRISTKGLMVNMRNPMVVELTLPSLQQLHVVGSGDSRVNGFSGESLQLTLHGSGDVAFDGKYKNLSGSLSGSGDLVIHNSESDKMELQLQGSGDVHATGSTKVLDAKLVGSGDFDATQLMSDSVTLKLMGSGDANVHAKTAVAIDIMGSGDVNVSGAPVQRSISKKGSGEANFD